MGVARLNLTLACGDYDRTRAIKTGEVRPDGVELNVVTLAPEEMFYRMARFREFDVSELSLSTYTVLRGRGEPLVAVPVFPSFSFRHSSIFVGAAAGIAAPKDLIGKRVGVPKYHMTAAVWIRGMLEDEYGVAPKDVHWFEGGEGSLVKEVDVTLPPDVRRESVPAGRNLGDMVAAGELDAFVGARRPAAFGERVRRLFPDFRRVERAYYEKTGIFPIMHTLVLKEELARQHPWLPRSLYDAFVESKWLAYQRLQFTAEDPGDAGGLHLPAGAGAAPAQSRGDVLGVDPGDLKADGVETIRCRLSSPLAASVHGETGAAWWWAPALPAVFA